jgi:tetratricopeptide (TPR) repeat protein
VQEARTLDPHNERLTERLLHLWTAQGQTTAALDLVRSQARTWRWLQWEGDLLVQAGDDMTATARYGLALAQLDSRFDVSRDKYLAPIKARILIARAHAYRRLDQIDAADEHYQAAGQIIPDDPTLAFNRGLLAFARGDHEAAVQLCREGLAHANATLHNEMLAVLRANYIELLESLS